MKQLDKVLNFITGSIMAFAVGWMICLVMISGVYKSWSW